MLLTRKNSSARTRHGRTAGLVDSVARGVESALSATMNRRSFLKRSGIGLGAGAAASTITFRSIRPAQAAQAQEEAEQLLAQLRDDGERYVRLRLAAEVLRGAIQRRREQSQGPVLARASELFRDLTLGSFAGLRVDFDEEGEAVLVGLRPGGQTVSVTGMSDGTCDQLYLALRLASLETYLADREPLPVVVDDILIQFDDRRAAAALEALVELSRKTQVLFFTHHRHLVDLAEQRGVVEHDERGVRPRLIRHTDGGCGCVRRPRTAVRRP